MPTFKHIGMSMTITEKDLENWEEFENEVSCLLENNKNSTSPSTSGFLFRGQSNSTWKLETTLERYTNEVNDLVAYYRHALIARPAIEAMSDRSWEMPAFDEFQHLIETNTYPQFQAIPGYEFIAYIRHHGFPSPLLD